jgi:hypothetical protein
MDWPIRLLESLGDALRMADLLSRGIEEDQALSFGQLSKPEQRRWTIQAAVALDHLEECGYAQELRNEGPGVPEFLA